MNNTASVQPSIAIVGAGPAGLHCAAALLARGKRLETLHLFDKSRGIAGRLASRRRPGFEWHHGAAQADLAPGSRVGARAYRAGLKVAASTLPITFGAELCSARYDPLGSSRWSLEFRDGRTLSCDTLLLCLPAPQIETLLSSSPAAPLPDIATAVYEPRFSLLLGLKRPLRRDPELKWPFEDQSIGSDRRSLVLHAGRKWSEAHLEQPRDSIALKLLGAVPRRLKRHGVLRVMAHRWRYGLVVEAAGVPCVWDAERQLGAAGDWCLGRSVGAAIDSGVALACAV